jgi:hypothetical protein
MRAKLSGRVVLAWFALLAADVLLRTRGFGAIYRFVKRWPVKQKRGAAIDDARAICSRVDRASAFYFKRAWCLQRSAVTVVLLRSKGFPAQLSIGVQSIPFLAHAWVELDGRVINDDEAAIRKRFALMERC